MPSEVFNDYDVWDGDIDEESGVSPDEYAEILEALYAITESDVSGDIEYAYLDDYDDDDDDTPVCLTCAEHCPMDDLGCDRGREYFGFETPASTYEMNDDVPF